MIPLLTVINSQAWADTYALVTDASTLASGDEIIIVNTGVTKALSTTQNSSNRGAADVTVSNDKITPSASVQVITLGTRVINYKTYWTFSVGSNKWLYAASSSSNQLKTQTTLDNNGSWSIALNNSSEATIQAQGTNSRNLLKYNSGSTIFSCYGSGQVAIKIYKKEVAAYTVTASSNNNSWGTVSVSGTTITATPADCYQVVSGTGGYTVTSGTATVSHTGTSNTLTVTPSTNCAVQVNFEKKTVNTYVDEIQDNGTIEDCSTTAPSLTDKSAATTGTCAQQHYHFMGWVTAANKANPTDDNIIEAGETVAVNGTTYYAVWAKGTGGGGFDGEHGGTFKIYADVSGTKYYATSSISSGKLGSTTNASNAAEFTITAVTGGFTIQAADNDYIGYGSSTNLTKSGTSYTWTFASGAHGASWRVNSGSSGRAWIYRAGSTNKFGGYSTGNVDGSEYFDLEIGGGYEYSDYITTCGSTYTITLANSGTVTGGTFTASAASASQGTVITLTATPERGYGLGSWNVTDASSNPVSVSNNQFTMPASNVTVSATFNTATPLTITLSTNSKGTFTNPDPWPIYSGETFIFPSVTPNDPTCATFVGWIQGTTFPGDGSTHDEPTGLITAGTESTAQTTDATYTAVFYETETAESDAYVKVTSAPANWVNDHYLIVYEGDATHAAVAFDGKRDNGDNGNIDAASNGVEVTITNDAIAKTARLAAAEWRIAAVTGGHSIQSASGFYIGQTTDANGLQNNSSTAYVNTLAYSSGFSVTGSGNAVLRYNYASDQLRFRYYKSSSYSSQQVIQLYKLGTAEVQTRTYTTNPSCTPKYRVTVASVTGGSPNADPRYNPETTEVSLTANPSAGYAFTSWTITKTTGGDNVTTTLLPGAKATTANTTFSMPAYDVTVTAAYSKKAVTELKVMDGSTVVANTTGSVSGTLNVSTGANKTLDVVITPSDAFDHSWTATVTAGGTYASITNVTDDGFRVNGLAQGDATITVNAPNEGAAKTVTFTVHVTDILPEEIILKRDGSETPINALTIYLDQYAKINVSYSPTPTDKAFTFSSADATSVSSHAHASTSGYETLHGLKVTSSPVNCTFTSAATSSVTKVLAVTVLPCPADQFVDYIHGNATVTRAAQVSADHCSINTSITTPTLSDAAESASADCEAGHYHLIGWLPQSIAEALFEAGTPITSETEGLVTAGAEIEASGITWYAIWAKKE